MPCIYYVVVFVELEILVSLLRPGCNRSVIVIVLLLTFYRGVPLYARFNTVDIQNKSYCLSSAML